MRIALVATDTDGWRLPVTSGEDAASDGGRGTVAGGEAAGEDDPDCRPHRQAVAERLGARDHHVQLFCPRFWADEMGEEVRRAGVTYRGLGASVSAGFLARLPLALVRFGPHVVHAAPTPASAVLAADAGGLTGAPLVVEWSGRESPPQSWTLRRSLRAPKATVVPSGVIGTRVRELGVPDDAVVQVPRGIDARLVRETEPRDGADVVASGPLDDAAHLDDLLLALAEHRDRAWSLLVIGDGPERGRFEQQTRDLRIAERVRFAGDPSRRKRVARYRDSHVAVHTRDDVPFATELLWALAAGCVGVVEYQPGSAAHELVEGHERGLLATSPEELETALLSAADHDVRDYDPEFERFDHGAVIERYLECYREAGASPD
jgi:glycosyltransferase involved in cell wall biosynthesis